MSRHRLPHVLWVGFAALLLSTPAVSQAPRAERPTYATGARWILGDGAYELRRVDRDGYVFSTSGREIHLTRDLALARVVRAGVTLWELHPPPRPTWPLEVGKWGVTVSTLRLRDVFDPIPVRVSWQVAAYEDIKVPGGTFKAFRVTYTINLDGGGLLGGGRVVGGRNFWVVETWYAPAAQVLVKARAVGTDALDFEVAALEEPASSPVAGAAGREPARAGAEPPPTPLPTSVPPGTAPPLLAIQMRYPDDQARLSEETVLVAAVATSSRGIVGVSVTVNGTEAYKAQEASPQTAVPVVASVKLREGRNVVMVTAQEVGGAVRQEARVVIREAPAASGSVPQPVPVRDRWAVVIGVSQYDSRDVPQLPYAVADAEAFYDLLVNQAGFQKERVLLLTDKTERKPTLRSVKYALGTFLARAAKKEDLVVVFFAGHGAPEVDPRGIEPDGLAKYLVPIDADPNDLYSTALPMDELQTIFDRLEAERVVVFLDSCYSGAAGGRTFASRRTRATRVDDVFLERMTRSKGRVIVTAARSSEVSIELPEIGHGLFTYYLLQGLRGTADLDRDGLISLQELYQYVEQQVSRRSRALGGNQHPMMKGELEGSLPLVRLGGR